MLEEQFQILQCSSLHETKYIARDLFAHDLFTRGLLCVCLLTSTLSHLSADGAGFGLSTQLRGINARGGNPITNLVLFRPFVVHLFPGVAIIDGLAVTQVVAGLLEYFWSLPGCIVSSKNVC